MKPDTTQQLLSLILENRQAIADLKTLIVESKEELRNWFLLTGLAVIPIIVYLHGYLHPVEYGRLEKKMKRQSRTLGRMLKKAKKLEDIGTLPPSDG